MVEKSIQRRIAAIRAAEVMGCSRMMGPDEAGTLAALHGVWTLHFYPAEADYRGRIVKMTGVGAMAEFSSTVDAAEAQRLRDGLAKAGLPDGFAIPT